MALTRRRVRRLANDGVKKYHKVGCLAARHGEQSYSPESCYASCLAFNVAGQCLCTKDFSAHDSCYSQQFRDRAPTPPSCDGMKRLVPNCDRTAEKKCCLRKHIGDGNPDCSFAKRPKTWTGCDLSCYSDDGGDLGC